MATGEIHIYPLEQYMHRRHPSLRKFILPDVPVVTNGRVVNWEPPEAIHQALTAVQDKRNKPVADPLRKKAYLRSLYSAAARHDVAGMRNAVSAYPDMVPQIR